MMAQNQTHNALVLKSVIVAITLAMLCGCGMAQSSSGCTNVIISMSPCLNYITGNSSTPSSGCCTQLASVVRSQPKCLCEVLNGGGSSLGLNINQAQALELPKACNVQTPPTSECNASSPGNSPTTTPSSSSPNNPSDTGRGSNSVPSTNDGSSDAVSIRLATIPLLSLIVSAYATTF
ncbi:non-specific lipid-transfer protein-like protein At2g13820 [Cynara cardunculus var. scolymus]|uniref:Bifunctional inhibitor/plant lipid transfer protein/seed storage helical domain-containing protein n=1 Tax=Cynara cardunculus var. scolymus TaxID=59895 RepID=A0A103YFS4_CYNCS|nr:non-specific lipid-transfer protein-like protein At2g13820 [Cynara cardunculus var. scolymus]KVI08299.1 Bifunctional inhibitor/plant lipid transfer protein/seed storage helical domain-containing protein [Cynara cardunculus var. scolymus]